MTKSFGPLILLIVLIGLPARHAMATLDESGVWIVGSYTHSFGTQDQPSRWRYSLQGQARKFTLLDGTRQAVGRGGLGYKINDRLTLWGGYAYYHTRVNSVGSTYEHRLWQQLSWTVGRGSWGSFKSRTRLEQRFRHQRDGTGWHIRQQFKVDFPIGQQKLWSLIVADEVHFHLRDTSWSTKGFSQNRLFLGTGYKISGQATIEVGYMNQLIRLRDSPDLINHLLIVKFKFK